MGKGNTVVRQWLRNRERFADLFNGQLFNGKQIILPEDLEPVDSVADVLVKDKSGKAKEVQRYRDIVMRWKNGTMLVMLGCENQAYFRNVDGETYEVIREFLHSERILKKEVSLKKEEKIDMCQALEESVETIEKIVKEI